MNCNDIFVKGLKISGDNLLSPSIHMAMFAGFITALKVLKYL